MIKSIKNELPKYSVKQKPMKASSSVLLSNKKPKLYTKVEEYILHEKIADKLLQQKYIMLRRKYFNG